jgi:hypothetical protein
MTPATAEARRAPQLARTLLFALNIAIAASYVGLWLIAAREGLFWRADFTQLYTGATMARAGAGDQLYDLASQARYQQQILAGRSFADGLLPFNYPPHVALLLAPLSLLPLPAAFALWTALQLGLLALAARLIGALSAGWAAAERRQLLVAALALPALLGTLMRGNVSLLLLVALLLWLRARRGGRPLAAGAWLAAQLIKPQLAALPLASLLGGRRWAELAAAAAWGAGLLIVSGLALGWEAWLGYPAMLRFSNAAYDAYGIHPPLMYNLKGMLAWALGPQQASLISLISSAGFGLALLGLIWLWRDPWRPDSRAFDLRVALTVTLGLLFSPHTYSHDLLLLVVPALLAIGAAPRGRATPATLIFAAPLALMACDLLIGGPTGVRLGTLLISGFALWLARALAELRASPAGA